MIIVCALILTVISPLITFWFGYLSGMLCNLMLGDKLVNGLNFLFNTDRFTENFIPLTMATLAVIGNRFKSTSTSKK